jgi:hypothetical protein
MTEGESSLAPEDPEESRQAAKAAKGAGIRARPLDSLGDSLGAFAAWRPLPLVFEDRDR